LICVVILIIYNPVSGGKKAKQSFGLFQVYARFQQLTYVAYETAQSKDYKGITSAFDKAQPHLVISCGGDGTANDVVNALYRPEYVNEVPLLVLPAGSGNDFSTQLYGKKKPKDLFTMIQEHQVKKVDLGECNKSLFLNGIGIGFDGSIAQNTSSNKNRILPTTLKYYLAIFKNLFVFNEFDYHTSANRTNRKGFIVAISNGNCYGGGFKIAPNAKLDDGLLDVVEIGAVSKIKRPIYIPIVEKGKHLNLSFVTHHQTQHIEIKSGSLQQLQAHADGEHFEAHTFKIEVLLAALPVPV